MGGDLALYLGLAVLAMMAVSGLATVLLVFAVAHLAITRGRRVYAAVVALAALAGGVAMYKWMEFPWARHESFTTAVWFSAGAILGGWGMLGLGYVAPRVGRGVRDWLLSGSQSVRGGPSERRGPRGSGF